jgi:hypothetical protein
VREALRYQFPPPEHKHLLGPFTTGQIAITLVTLFIAVFGIARPNPTLPRITLTAGLILAVVVPVAVPWRGRIVTEWVPIAARYLRTRRAGRTDYRASVRQGTGAAGQVLLPDEVGAVEFLAHPHNGGVLGVAVDRRVGLYTGVLEVESPSFLLEETARQEELMARWGVVLARLASSGTDVHPGEQPAGGGLGHHPIEGRRPGHAVSSRVAHGVLQGVIPPERRERPDCGEERNPLTRSCRPLWPRHRTRG